MKRYRFKNLSKLILFFILVLLSLKSFSDQVKNDSKDIITLDKILGVIKRFEEVINHNPPTKLDYWVFMYNENPKDYDKVSIGYHESDERKIELEESFCSDFLKVNINKGECDFFIENKNSPSLYLLWIKNVLTNKQNLSIKIFVDSHIEGCNIDETERASYKKVKAIALIGNRDFKKVEFYITCNKVEANSTGILYNIKINDKFLYQYPFEEFVYKDPLIIEIKRKLESK